MGRIDVTIKARAFSGGTTTVTPAGISRTVVLPSPLAGAISNVTAAPAAIARAAVTPLPLLSAGSRITPALISRAAVVPAPASVAGGVSAPTAAYTSGSQVGVPTGTTLTTRTGNSLGSPNAADETIILTHPVTGVQQALTVQVYRRLQWTDTLQQGPVAQDTHILFDECKFAPAGSAYFCVDFETWFSGRTEDIMKPAGIFRRCTFDGGFHTGKGLAMHRYWLINSEIVKAEDGCIGSAYSVAMNSNIYASINYDSADAPGGDPHPDCFQMTDTGHTVLYRNWLSDSGLTGFYQTSGCVALGMEFGPTEDIGLYYNAFNGTFNTTVICRESYGNRAQNIRVVGNRWRDDGPGFMTEFTQTGTPLMISEWSNNSRAIDGTREGTFYPAGYVLTNPGV